MASTPYPRSDRELLQRIARSSGGKAGYKQLVRELGLGGGRERRLLVEQLTRMVARGELRQMADGLWGIPKQEKTVEPASGAAPRTASETASGQNTDARSGRDRFVTGRLDLHRDGFGFVRPEARGSAPVESIYISPHDLSGAMQGDLVLVDETPGRDGRRAGRIARVLTRRNPTIVGIFHYAHQKARGAAKNFPMDRFGLGTPRGNYVRPMDERVAAFIDIPPGAEVVAATVDSPHRTIGEEARSEGPGLWVQGLRVQGLEGEEPQGDARWPLEGLAVDVEITQFPASGRPAQGQVIEVLGRPEDFGVDVEIVIRKHHLPHVFPPAVLAEAEESAGNTVERVAADDPEEFALREDFRGLPVVTIDGETARDFDDAVYLRELPNGNTELQVHIADVSAYVLPGSPLDTEARVRGTSVYFPDRAVPMLPAALSSGMCSLRPEEDRLVQSCVMEIDPRGEVVGYRVCEGVIRSVRRCTYTSVQRCLNASPERQGAGSRGQGSESVTPEPTAEDFAERERVGLEQPEMPAAFDRMLELALRLNAKRVRRGSIDFDLPEPVIEFDPDGNMKAIVRSERGWAHRLIEEFMLSANECVATWLTQQGIPSIYRIHELPDPKRILEFEEQAARFGQSLGIGSLPVKRLTMKADRREAVRRNDRGRNRGSIQGHEVVGSIAVTPQMYQKLVKKIAGRTEERILSYLMLRSLKQARYAEKNEGHFALASPCYTHFTSPIRRYPDLIVHRLLRAMLRSGADPRGGAVLSTDKQPWEAKGPGPRVQGPGTEESTRRKTGSSSGDGHVLRHKENTEAEHRVPAKRSAKANRAGRIGWTSDAPDEGVLIEETLNGAGEGTDVSSEPWTLDPGPLPTEPLSAAELNDIAVESSQAERRAADAERELIEWKKMRFMADKVGDDFKAIILSVTKYGFFVELDEMFVEGMVPLASLVGDHWAFRETDRSICGARTGHCFSAGQRVEVILDCIDRQTRRLQFALLPGTEPVANTGVGSLRKPKAKKQAAESKVGVSKTAGAKPKKKTKAKSKRKKKQRDLDS